LNRNEIRWTPAEVGKGQSCRVRIGEWSVDPETNELTRGTETVRIEPKAMDVLVLLADRAGRVVGREELFVTVWPGVVVGDEAITQTIIKLRKALGDNPRSPSYIETIAKRGYRLIASVERTAPVENVATGVDRAGDGARRFRPVWFAALFAALAAVGAYLLPMGPRGDAVLDTIGVEDSRQPGWVGITIVPFESVGVDAEQAYLASGISDNLMTDLARVSGLRVIRESAAATSGAKRSSARYRVSGSVQREGGTLRISIHLVDAETREQLWSERFERQFGELFAIQDDMTATLVNLLPAKLSNVERQRLAKRHTRSLEAYDYFLQGRVLFLVRGGAENEEARALYRKALDADPKFARAYASMALTYAMDYRLGLSADRAAALDRAFELAETARQIDPDVPEVYWSLGFVHAQSRRHEKAIESLQKAIELDRSFADAYALLGGVLTYIGRPAQSIPLLRQAMRLNPDGGYLYFLLLGRAFLFENDVEQALINLRAASLRNPADVETRIYLAAASAAGGDRRAAAWEGHEIRSLEPNFSLRDWLATYPMVSSRHTERLLALLADAEL
jgi:DNA-binding winged helix-turn-helix (wHTH) protein/TolB-like protein